MKTYSVNFKAFSLLVRKVIVLLLGALVWASAHAADVPNQLVESSGLAPIVVDARLWNEEDSAVPGSIDVVGVNALESHASNTVDVVAGRSSNIVVEQSSAQTRVVIRGNAGIDLGLQDPVGYFVNDIALPLGGNQLPDMSNFKQIQILKGPQGSAYGRNTEAGAIKFTTADASWNVSRWFDFSAGAIDGADGWTPTSHLLLGAENTLIKNVLAGSVGVNIEKTQGPHFNRLTGNDEGGKVNRWGIQTGLNYLVNDNTDMQFKSIIEDNDQQRTRFRLLNGRASTPRFVTNSNTEGFDDQKTSVHSLKVTHLMGDYELTAITGFTDYVRKFLIDLDVTPAPLPPTQLGLNDQTVSQELRLASTNLASRGRWLAGLYAFDQNTETDFSISPFFMTTHRNTKIDQQGIAGYGQIDYELWSGLEVGLGVRVEHVKQTGQQRFQSSHFDGQYSQDIDETEVLPKLTLSYVVSASNRVYASASKGYLSGGYNYNSAGNLQTFTYAPEFSNNVELGLKSNWMNNRINSQVAAFYTRIDDKQVVDTVPGGLQRISNAAEAKIKGLELSLEALVGNRFSLFGELGVQDAKATDFQAKVFRNGSVATADLSGNRLPLAADYTYALGVHYGQSSQTGLRATIHAQGFSDYYFDSQNTIKQPSYSLVNAEIAYQFEALKLALWARNIFDEEVISRAVNTPNGIVVEDSNSRVIGLQLSAKW